ncbi:hypothetical protein SRB5_46360 [Streptomyces sp. RB5]|uniref:Uncharacterized protein n=1 Tax=Streptomyces smaragdinus TaxID=2585196 RepID=A0A7K0CLV2_9ACTN|nr:hypothetical protein [Streptomyces smaragdinus]MQY14469.1 hypothetical protein [Streptomyces smaragdinus]
MTNASPPRSPLLTLTGLLLLLTVSVNLLASWSSWGNGARVAAFAAVTVVAGGVSAQLRGPAAEAFAAMTLLLTLATAAAVEALVDPSDDSGFWTLALALLTAGWLGYGLLLRELRLPLPACVAAGQLVLPLLAFAAGSEAGAPWALIATGLADVAVWRVTTRPSVRTTALVAAFVVGGWGVLDAIARMG